MTTAKEDGQAIDKGTKAILAGIAGAVLGAIAGAIIGLSLAGSDGTLAGAVAGAIVGALIFGLVEGITDFLRKPGAMKPLAYRILSATVAGGVVGGLLGLLIPGISLLVVGLVTGLLSGLFGLHWKKLLLGVAMGLLLGALAVLALPELQPAILGAAVVLIYRLLSHWLFRGPQTISMVAERVPAESVRYVVPFEANSSYVGADYFKDLARTEGGAFKRNAKDIGIVATMDSLRGPYFDPQRVDPLIREFYEHTSRFKLSIEPVWRPRMKPLFWLFKRLVAQRIGQANLPFNQEEAQHGIVSYIDSIDFHCNDIIDLRGWVRAFEESGEAIYVGIYTTFRHEDIGYVSVGFPLPDSNFTATLLPHNLNEHNLILKSRDTGMSYPGHYLATNEDGELTVVELPTFGEEIEVYVRDGHLKTDHRFYLSNLLFLTLYYTIERSHAVS